MKKLSSLIVNVSLLALLVTGCATGLGEEGNDINNTTETTLPSVSAPPSSEDMVLASKYDLSQRLCINMEEINAVFVKAVTWSDTSLGYPQEGMEYAQVITEGYQILLEVEDQLYEYHTDNKNVVVLCAFAPSNEVDIPDQDTSVEDGWPNQPIGADVIIITPTKLGADANVQDGWPNQPIDGGDVIITTPEK